MFPQHPERFLVDGLVQDEEGIWGGGFVCVGAEELGWIPVHFAGFWKFKRVRMVWYTCIQMVFVAGSGIWWS